MTSADLDFAVEQTGREGWASGRRDFGLYLQHDPEGCFIARDGKRPIGMVTTTRYTESGWIGNLIVAPEHRSRGIGRVLMERGLAHLEASGIRTVRLDGDPPGIRLYRSLGFVDEWESRRYRCESRALDVPPGIENLSSRDIDRVAAFDMSRFGDDRRSLLRLFLENSEHAFCHSDSGTLSGYLMMTRSDLGLRIGPCVADDGTTALLLFSAAVASGGGMDLTVGVPGPNDGAGSILELFGFESTPSSRRMVRGPRRAVGRLDHVFAIANGAVG